MVKIINRYWLNQKLINKQVHLFFSYYKRKVIVISFLNFTVHFNRDK